MIWSLIFLGFVCLQTAWPQADTKGEANQIKLGELALADPILISLHGAPSKGADSARIVIVEFADYQCPYCAVHGIQVLPQIVKDYVATGKVKYVFRDAPSEVAHPLAEKAAEAARCAADQGKFWEMHERLLSNQGLLAGKELLAHAQAVGLAPGEFQECLDGGKYAAQVRRDFKDGLHAGINATPSFFIGMASGKEETVKAVSMVVGALPYTTFKVAIDKVLSSEVNAVAHTSDTDSVTSEDAIGRNKEVNQD